MITKRMRHNLIREIVIENIQSSSPQLIVSAFVDHFKCLWAKDFTYNLNEIWWDNISHISFRKDLNVCVDLLSEDEILGSIWWDNMSYIS